MKIKLNKVKITFFAIIINKKNYYWNEQSIKKQATQWIKLYARSPELS